MANIKVKPRKLGVVPAKKASSEQKTTKPATVERVAAQRFVHDIQSVYSGLSPTLNARKSRTALRIGDFRTAPELVMSERDMAILGPLKAKYGKKQFLRGNADAGILNRAIRKGVVKFVSGDPTHETALLAFA